MAQTLDQIIASRKSLYDPERQLINEQKTALPGQEAAAVSALDTAKTNAFGDITNSANARGVVYSGAPIQEQNRYVGEKYLPARAGVTSTFAANRSKLEEALLGINRDETTSAQQLQTAQQKAEADASNKAEQLALTRERMANSMAIASTRASKAVDPAKGFQRISGASGLAYRDAHGNPITAAAYYGAKGGSIDAIKADLMGSQNEGDALVAADIGRLSQAQLIKKYPWIFGG